MPWAKLSYERIQSVYPEILDKLAEKRLKADLTAMEVLIRAEIIKRDFTKRQLTILSYIITFSYSFGKESALLPKLKDFSIAGISQTKVTDELNKLVEMNVLIWERGKDTNEFSINDPREWKGVPYHSTYDDVRSRELFILNLKHAGVTFNTDDINQKVFTEDGRRRSNI